MNTPKGNIRKKSRQIINKTKFLKLSARGFLTTSAAAASFIPVFATNLLTNGTIDSVTFNNEMTFGGMISKFAGLALGVIAAIGFIMLIIGAGMYAFAQNSEDGSMQIRGTRMAIAGMIALGISGILALMGLTGSSSSSSGSTSSNDVYTSE